MFGVQDSTTPVLLPLNTFSPTRKSLVVNTGLNTSKYSSANLTNCSQCSQQYLEFPSLKYIFETILNIASSSTKLRDRSDNWEKSVVMVR